jgi:NADP-dependent 3-hydroxy acid dehydrogenase YdfG
LVTGAASGIGLGIASALAQAGVKVMLCDIEQGALAAALEKLKSRAGTSCRPARSPA